VRKRVPFPIRKERRQVRSKEERDRTENKKVTLKKEQAVVTKRKGRETQGETVRLSCGKKERTLDKLR